MSLEVQLRARAGTFELAVEFASRAGITALLGPSGAGKTLTLRAIAGLVRPARGRIALAGRTLFDSAGGVDLPPRSRRIGYVFQQYALFPHLNVGANVAYGIADLRPPERAERVGQLLELVGLAGFQRRSPQQLSGGQQQRVALARALANHPRLLLLDEPFAAVDHHLRRRLRAELRRLHEATGIPMLFVTHDLREVRELAESLVLLRDGTVVRAGSAAEMLAHPLDRELAEME